MAPSCCYPDCKSNRKDNPKLTFFHFPEHDKQRTLIWQKRCGKPHDILLPRQRLIKLLVCEKHFSHQQMRQTGRRKLLLRDANPIRVSPLIVEPMTEHSTSEDIPSIPPEIMQDMRDMLNEMPVAADSALDIKEEEEEEEQVPDDSPMDMEVDDSLDIKEEQVTINGVCIPSSQDTNQQEATTTKKTKSLLETSSPCDTIADGSLDIKEEQVTINGVYTPTPQEATTGVESLPKKPKISRRDIVQRMLAKKSQPVSALVNMQLFSRDAAWTQDERETALSLYFKSPPNYAHMVENLKFVLPSIATIHSWLDVGLLQTGLSDKLTTLLRAKVATMTDTERMCVLLFDEIAITRARNYNEQMDCVEGYEDLAHIGRTCHPATSATVFFIRGLISNWRIPLCYFLSRSNATGAHLKSMLETILSYLQQRIGLNPCAIVCDNGPTARCAVESLDAQSYCTYENTKLFIIYDMPHLMKRMADAFRNPRYTFKYGDDQLEVSGQELAAVFGSLSSRTSLLDRVAKMHQKRRVDDGALITAQFVVDIEEMLASLQKPLRSVKTLLAGRQYFTDRITVFDRTGRDKPKNNLYCWEGMQNTITAIVALWHSVTDKGYPHLKPKHLTLQPLEELFGELRNRRRSPTVRELRIGLQHNMSVRLALSLDDANCDLREIAEWRRIDYDHLIVVPPSITNETNPGTQEKCSETYLVAYVAHWALTKFDCNQCRAAFLREDTPLDNEQELRALVQLFPGAAEIKSMLPASVEFHAIIMCLNAGFETTLAKTNAGATKLKVTLRGNMIRFLMLAHPKWYNIRDACAEHKKLIINFILDSNLQQALKLPL